MYKFYTITIDSETTALAYTDALTIGNQQGFDQFHKNASKHLSKIEIAELAAIIINMNLWTRLKLAQGATPVL